ncbi:TfoX/Sxy family DNA transformation protein [Marinomonas sp. 15G1-11]|uniref:TfoX/Sxy family DNA transformation protein n=1 Tax=Marinomonas phaeophyticola TaxID=3004091 RepID=A0ABT4JYX9_9GAMM|nr:TfoX/Sxy family DNA transformation protein [Marinomonas sp. 15G1-11]MCZ2723435.1 TfoX/Sxy family DNA transformation protein [Marinomonas sp. 15G1-11]
MARSNRLRDLKGFGIKTEELLNAVGIDSVTTYLNSDPILVYASIVEYKGTTNMNLLYALIGAHENVTWLEIAKTRRSELLLSLDDLGLAPK